MKFTSASEEEQERMAEEILSIVDEGQDMGVVGTNEARMIKNIFEYQQKDAKDIMTHRKQIRGINGEDTLSNVLHFILEENNSRFPVYQEDIDNILGTMHIRDVMTCYFREENKEKRILDLKDEIRPVSFVPETKGIHKLFNQMQAEKNHMAIVVDEYGQTAGVVTMEDILEEIVGNILDEYDEEEVLINKVGDCLWMVNGMMPLSDLEKVLNISFDAKDVETLNGFFIYKLEHIPQDGERAFIDYENYRFSIVKTENNMIQTVKIERNEKERNL